MKSVTKAILSCDCVTFDTLLFCMTCLRMPALCFIRSTRHMLFASTFRVEDRSKDRRNTRVIEWGKTYVIWFIFAFRYRNVYNQRQFLFPLGLRSICVHAPCARVWDISISLYCMLIALFLLFVFFTSFQM